MGTAIVRTIANSRYLPAVFASLVLFGVFSESVHGDEASALDVFRQRIAPILNAKNPSSCSDCHLSGVDLKGYIRGDAAQTFAALRLAGLVDVQRPAESKLLKFIRRAPELPSLVSEKIRREEHDAFLAWIQLAVKDPTLLAATTDDAALGASLPVEVIRHQRLDRVLDSFVQNVWSEVGRCAACHSPDRNQQQVKKFGEQVSWIQLRNPQATLQRMLDNQLIDLERPEKSLLLLKPTRQVEHGGGVKMTIGDRTYTQFRGFIEDYAASKKGSYRVAADLPTPSTERSAVSEIWLKLTNVPAKFDQKTLRVNLHRWDEASGRWSSDRWATADRQAAGDRKLWQQHLSITAPNDSQRAARLTAAAVLPAGKYLAKIYVDVEGRLERLYPYELGEAELAGQVEITSDWPVGYGRMTSVAYPAPF